MPRLRLVYDLRRAPFSPASSTALVATAIEQCEWADQRGFFQVSVSEHHGSSDGYVPTPLTVLAAIAARTTCLRLVPIILAPLHDPIGLAEEIAMVDLISAGRLDPLIGAGYVPAEFVMFGKDLGDRVAAQEECVEVLKRAWTGEPFEYRGTTVQVTPRPHQQPRPLITLGGMSAGAARRAARIAARFEAGEPGHWRHYEAECARLGRDPGPRARGGPAFVYVTEDPDASWPLLAPYSCITSLNTAAGYTRALDAGLVPSVRRAICLACKSIPRSRLSRRNSVLVWRSDSIPTASWAFTPLMGGLPGDLSWASLELFADKVLPHLSVVPPNEGVQDGRHP
jgi:alkanesulfonate monooxygenase SsuD/methylene tetrahydromethanopterin reductase-like flavin-dependent oxidoreductase (luciferase family)